MKTDAERKAYNAGWKDAEREIERETSEAAKWEAHYEQQRAKARRDNERNDRRLFWVGIILMLIILSIAFGPELWYSRIGAIKIHLVHNPDAKYEFERHTSIYASQSTWWGFGEDKRYPVKAINGKWHIRGHGENKNKWEVIYANEIPLPD